MDTVRKIFARETGAEPGLFSFNSGGACGTCEGRGIMYTDLAFMDPVTTTCPACEGRRFKDEVLRLVVGGRSVADVLGMTAEEALDFFHDTGVRRRLRALRDVGLTYLTLGQPLSTLSGGERQRIKLATRLHRKGVVYVLDEPTTGLHMADVDGLVGLLDRLVDAGNTVIVVEHNLDVVARADWVIDLGPPDVETVTGGTSRRRPGWSCPDPACMMAARRPREAGRSTDSPARRRQAPSDPKGAPCPARRPSSVVPLPVWRKGW
jgi:excinuclease UvrABC ATPase subunit